MGIDRPNPKSSNTPSNHPNRGATHEQETAKPTKPQAPKLPKGEAEQVRIRKEIGHDFALRDDAHGRKRLGGRHAGGAARLRGVE
ncbi:hypothetical protein [Mesorhizobium sp. PAMC28654]|uniref:hypothetical protein n=1 Tax=Mesorhizobium sp. PAMC28654 TaxID=2880934 RepID=UPI0039B3EF3B